MVIVVVVVVVVVAVVVGWCWDPCLAMDRRSIAVHNRPSCFADRIVHTDMAKQCEGHVVDRRRTGY